ncbi:MAG: long-chain fatty acid--CoA ligase [Bacteroidetes bacterium]|nr:long-chain fatty acid--CoA ligase [Bacteroidota bacterium]MBU1423084.1 long-chain fatty acid--CoA ligase [Bacteroidota bacterium]
MPLAVEFSTITEMCDNVLEKYSKTSRAVLMQKVDDKYKDIRYSELRDSINNFAFGLASIGVKQGDHVAIISENRPEWVVSDMAIHKLGAVDVPIYPTLTAKQIEFILNDGEVKFAIISNQFQLNKVKKAMGESKHLQKVIVIAEKGVETEKNILLYKNVCEEGEKFGLKNPDYFKKAKISVKPSDILTIIYTSGTTGNPKGVILTHLNLVSNIKAASQVLPITDEDVLLSFLPLCHSFERMAGYYTALGSGATIAYAESVETVRDNLAEVKPTIMTSVPRLFERIYGRIYKQVESAPPVRRKIFNWAIGVGRKYAIAKKHGYIPPTLAIQHQLADKLVFHKLKQATGGKIKFFVSGGAALGREFGEFFEAVGLKIIEGYGLTESSPVITANRLDDYKFGAVGKPIPGVEVKIAEDSEIWARGPNIMKGYWNNKHATEEAIDKEGWLHTGDIGVFDADGFLIITDRKKHMFVSSGGKNIYPQPIEGLFLQSKYIDQFVLVGDRRMFLSALIVPDFDAIKEYADRNKISYTNEEDLVDKQEIYDIIDKEVATLQKDLANYERVRKFVLLHKPLSLENGEITPTMKIKRKAVEKKYSGLIEEMYQVGK